MQLYGSTSKSDISISFLIEPDTKIVTLDICEIPKGGGNKVLQNFYCIEDELYEYINKQYLLKNE